MVHIYSSGDPAFLTSLPRLPVPTPGASHSPPAPRRRRCERPSSHGCSCARCPPQTGRPGTRYCPKHSQKKTWRQNKTSHWNTSYTEMLSSVSCLNDLILPSTYMFRPVTHRESFPTHFSHVGVGALVEGIPQFSVVVRLASEALWCLRGNSCGQAQRNHVENFSGLVCYSNKVF